MLKDLSDEVKKKRRTIQHTKWNNELTSYEAKINATLQIWQERFSILSETVLYLNCFVFER